MKIDLHVHSKFSTRPSQWVLQKIGCPESFTDPLRLRDIAMERGMSLVTITDHNTIDGALEIAHLPNAFVSEEITTYFPEDGCKIHVLAFNISEDQHADIQKIRASIFDLVDYLRGEGIIHVVAHPLYSTNDRMNADHFEQLLLLFKNFRKGLSYAKIRLFPRGVDTERFHPSRRDVQFVQKYNGNDAFNLLYVGRVSREKNLPLLVEVFRGLSPSIPRLSLIVAGDGPYLEDMKRELGGTRACFTGYLTGEALSRLYASCDLFVFPSTTDTFGNVVLEAQASQLPVVVTDSGGPQENVIPGKTGIVVPAHDGLSLAAAIRSLIDNPKKLRQMGKAARLYAEGRSFESAFEQTWKMYGERDMDLTPHQDIFARAV